MNSKQLAADRAHVRGLAFIVNTPQHYTTLRDGVYFDHIQHAKRGRRVQYVWRIEV
jgi:hypothetical protein